ncbi:hypothetical protein ACFUC1_18955 [Pedococcus sp. NPDC057267]|uniref:hypothetical protein n=1 Tax=Pedococcus sp. NPDC057267 TaxID=3346077 RepID=UPI00362DCF7B
MSRRRGGVVAAGVGAVLLLGCAGHALTGAAPATAVVSPAAGVAPAVTQAAADGATVGAAGSTRPATDRLVLVSGRDDHGLVELASVPLTDRAGGGAVVGAVPDGTLARPTRVLGTQVEVTSLDGTGVTGWVDDYRLRGVLRAARAADPCAGDQVVATRVAGSRVLVHALDGSAPRWVARSALAEVVSAVACTQGPAGSGQGAAAPDHGSAGHHH